MGDLGGGRETGEEDHLEGFAVAEGLRALGREDALFDRSRADLVDRDAASVVRDLDDDRSSLLAGAEADEADDGLAEADARRGRLNAVVDRVAQSVGEWVLDGFEQALVEARFHPGQLDPDDALAGLRQVTNHSGELLEQDADRLHARFHNALAEVRRDGIQAPAELGNAGRFEGGLQDLVAGEDELADQVHHAVQKVHFDADRAFAGSAEVFLWASAWCCVEGGRSGLWRSVARVPSPPVVLMRWRI